MTKIYVGNLPFDATEDAVRALFATHGVVEKLSLVTDRDTGRPKGFGFVEMDEHRPESPDSPELLRRTQSGPTTPRGSRDGFGWEEVSEEDPGMGTPGNTTGEDDEEDEED